MAIAAAMCLVRRICRHTSKGVILEVSSYSCRGSGINDHARVPCLCGTVVAGDIGSVRRRGQPVWRQRQHRRRLHLRAPDQSEPVLLGSQRPRPAGSRKHSRSSPCPPRWTRKQWRTDQAPGFAHACAIQHRPHASGAGATTGHGQLGVGDTTNRLRPNDRSTTAVWLPSPPGSRTPARLRTDFTMWCWGASGSGQLGQGDTIRRSSSPVQVGTSDNWLAEFCARAATTPAGSRSTFQPVVLGR